MTQITPEQLAAFNKYVETGQGERNVADKVKGKGGKSGEGPSTWDPSNSAMDAQIMDSGPMHFQAAERFGAGAPSSDFSGIRAAGPSISQAAARHSAPPAAGTGRYVDNRPGFDFSRSSGSRGGIAPGGSPAPRGFFDGGMAMQGPQMQPPPMPMQAPPMPPMQAPQMPQGPMQGEMGPDMGGGGDEMILLYNAAREVLINDPNGENPKSEQIIQMFIEIFGEEAFQALLMDTASPEGMGGPGMDPMAAEQVTGIEPMGMAYGGMIKGPGDGTSDTVRGNIDGVEEVRLSSGEYIIPADAVSGLGNGDSESGAKRLMSMVDSIRSARTGNTGLPPRV